MLEQVRSTLDRLKTVYTGSQGYSAQYALDHAQEAIDDIDVLQGVRIDDDKIQIFDPATGEDLVTWDNPSNEMVDVALAVRTFYAKGPNALKKNTKEI